jgi:hypothetical protein
MAREALGLRIDTRGLEALSDEQLRAGEILLEDKLVPQPLAEQEALFSRILEGPEFVATFLAEHEPPAEAFTERVPAPSLDPEPPTMRREPPEPPEVQEDPEKLVIDKEPQRRRIRRKYRPAGSEPASGRVVAGDLLPVSATRMEAASHAGAALR